MYKKINCIYLFLIIVVFFSNIFGQSKTVKLNKDLGEVDVGVFLHLKQITISEYNYILSFYFSSQWLVTTQEYKIDNIYVGNYKEVNITGIQLGKIYERKKNDSQIQFTVTIPKKHKKLYLEGIGLYLRCNRTIDLTEYDSFLSVNNISTTIDQNEDKEKPTLDLQSPHISDRIFRTNDFSIIIKGKAADNKGVYQVSINNKIVSLDKNGYFQKRLKLRIGKNPILIEVSDINDNKTSEEFIIIRNEFVVENEFSDVDFAFKTYQNKPDAVAVVIGIEEYQYAPDVTNAYNDAEIVREYLILTFGLKRENIYFRYNERATKGEFEKVFSRNGWIKKNANKESDIYVFYAGHGGVSINNKSGYLIPNDIDPNYPNTGYSLNDLYQNLSKIESKSITVILDACFSGISRENKMLLADSRPISIEIEQGKIPNNLNIFTASSGNEMSSGYSQKKHGLFTYFFLKGLNKEADANNNREITFDEMDIYLKENVSSQAKKMGRQQNPQLKTPDRNKVLLKY